MEISFVVLNFSKWTLYSSLMTDDESSKGRFVGKCSILWQGSHLKYIVYLSIMPIFTGKGQKVHLKISFISSYCIYYNYQFMAVCPMTLNFLHISPQKWLVFAKYFGLPNFLPQMPNFLHGYIRHIRDIFQLCSELIWNTEIELKRQYFAH